MTRFWTRINPRNVTRLCNLFIPEAVMREPYLWRTANMSWRTCVVVKQMQSNPIHTLRPRQNGRISRRSFQTHFLEKIYGFRLIFHWNLSVWAQLTIFHHWFREWLGADQATSHYLNQWFLCYRRIYASLGLNELMGHLTGHTLLGLICWQPVIYYFFHLLLHTAAHFTELY